MCCRGGLPVSVSDISKQIKEVMTSIKIREPVILVKKLVKKNMWSNSANLNLFCYLCIISNKSFMGEKMKKVFSHILFLQVIIFSSPVLLFNCQVIFMYGDWFFFFNCSSLLFISANYESPLTQCKAFQLFLQTLHKTQVLPSSKVSWDLALPPAGCWINYIPATLRGVSHSGVYLRLHG